MSRPAEELVLVCHWPTDRPYWLSDGLAEHGYNVTRFSTPWGRRRHRLLRSISAIRVGVAAAWYARRRHCRMVADWDGQTAGLVAALLGSRILCLNLILFEQGTTRTKIKRALYRLAFANAGATFTAGSAELCDRYSAFYGIKRERLFTLPDCYTPGEMRHLRLDPVGGDQESYVFCGGGAARDWHSVVAVAEALPEIPFMFVARQRTWPAMAVPHNVQVKFDIPHREFYEAMQGASMILVLLTDEIVTAGMMVLKHAALMGLVSICTSTPAAEAYFPDGSLLVPKGDSTSAARLVLRYWRDLSARTTMARRIQTHVLERYGPEAYVHGVVDALSRS